MTRIIRCAVLVLILAAVAAVASADPLAHRHTVGLNIGGWGLTADATVAVPPGSVSTSVGNDGILGGVFYGYWLEEDLAFTIDLDARDLDLQTDVQLTGVTYRSAALGSVLMGVQYYVPASTRGGNVRPYVGAGLGVYRGSQDEITAGLVTAVTSRSQSAFGGRLSLGVDFILGRHVLTGLSAGYNLMTDFGEPIAARDNYSGPEFSVGIGYVFGRSR